MNTSQSTRELMLEGLSPRERQVLSSLYVEDLSVGQVARRLSLSPGAVKALQVKAMKSLLTGSAGRAASRRRLQDVIESMLPEAVPSPAEAWHAQQSAQAREELLREFGALTAERVADEAGSRANNRSALASRWQSEGRAIAVPWRGRTLYPAFQFRAGRPLAIVQPTAVALRARGLRDWPLALWFVTPSGWLWDRRPVDLLEQEPEQVLAAAEEALSLPA